MHTERAISFAMENVVVVVVVTMREGSFGSGMRFDCENFSDPRFVMASSVVKVCSTRVNRTRCGVNGRLTMRVENKSLKSCAQTCKRTNEPDHNGVLELCFLLGECVLTSLRAIGV